MTTLFARLQSLYKANLLRGRITLAVIILFCVLAFIRISLAPAVIYGATSWLKKQNIDSSIESIDISFFNGTISLHNAKGSQDGKPLFTISLIDIDWSWKPLSEKTIEITRVVLDGFDIGIQKFTDNIVVGGVTIPLNKTDDTKDMPVEITETNEPWAAELSEVVFTNLNICYLEHTASLEQATDKNKFVDYCVTLGEMKWEGSIGYAIDKAILATNDVPISSSGDFSLNGFTLTDNKLNKTILNSKANIISNVEIKGLDHIHIDSLTMEDLSALQRDDAKHSDAMRFKKFAITNIDLKNTTALKIDSITLNAPGLYLVKQNKDQWEYQQWIPASENISKSLPAKTADIKIETKKARPAAFSVAINTIDVTDSDFCYQENQPSLHYCFTLDDFNWHGEINYTADPSSNLTNLIKDGTLTLSHPLIHNHTLKRELLKFDTLTISKINILNASDISFANLTLNDLTALQRSATANDNTLSFKHLAIDDVNYTGKKLAINTFSLDNVTNAISKNKDGSWEYDKWLPASSKATINTTTDSQPQDSAEKLSKQMSHEKAASKPADADRLLLSLNKINVTSNGSISFTDNSTEPAMEIGLQKMSLEAAKLDTSKPDVDSPIKFSAQTTRHSTIDLTGTARPFADKISLAIDGKLKGFDLRAASPAVKKAVGHIIKSGQLDADLTLKAVDGVLDSNVSLSLYQFNIKSVSKADATKLDDLFGMPLNQTLVLLRDKDNSIHLDIPITGDVTNPSFNPMDAIIKATSKAATVTLITFYTPYGLIYAGGNALFDLSTAMNFDPIKFNTGSAALLDENKKQLDNLSKLLTEKPQIHLTLCGITNQKDLISLYPDIDQSANRSKIVINDAQKATLAQLAQKRQDSTKNYLIDEGKLAADRLILCEPEHRTNDDAIAGIEINI